MTTYSVQIHVIQALNLIPGEKNFCIPLPVVECFSEQQVEKVTPEKTCSPFWDKMYCFEKTGIADLRTEKAVISVMDTNTWFQNDMIGQFSFELASIYDMPNHELYRRWCVLTHPDDAATGLTPKGWLKVSILCKKDTDPYPVHAEEDIYGDVATDDAGSLQDSILQPPLLNTKGYFLHLYINRAKDLIQMDTFGTTDPFVGASFAGGRIVRTRVINNETNPTFDEFIVIPVQQPAVSDVLELSVWNDNRTFGLGNDELISTHILSVKDIIRAGGMGPTWISLYCHPPSGIRGECLVDTMKLFRAQRRNEPERAFYCGSVLVEAFLEPTDTVIGGVPVARPVPLRSEPPMTKYVLRFIAHQVAEIRMGLLESVRVMVRWGPEERISEPVQVDEKTGQHYFMQTLPDIVMMLPEDTNQLPAVDVTIRKGFVGNGDRVAYKKSWPFDDLGDVRAELDDDGGTFRPRWHLLDRDWRETEAGNGIPPYLQYQLGVSRLDDPLVPPPPDHPAKPPTSQWTLRAHIFLARGLMAARQTGTSDPYVEVRCGAYSSTTTHRNGTLSPMWFESIECTAILPSDPLGDISSAPLIQLLLYDRQGGVMHEEIIGRGEVTITADMFITGIVTDYGATIPSPTWVELYSSVKDGMVQAAPSAAFADHQGADAPPDDPGSTFSPAGRLLVCFQIMHPSVARSQMARVGSPEWSIIPRYRPRRCLEVEAIALRSIVVPPTIRRATRITNPYLTVRVDDSSSYEHSIRGGPCNSPTSLSPNPNHVLRLPISEPFDPLFMPTILIELKHEPEGPGQPPQLLGRLELPLEAVLAGRGHDETPDGELLEDPEGAVRAVLEQAGLVTDHDGDGVGDWMAEDENVLACALGEPQVTDEEDDAGGALVNVSAGGDMQHTPAERLTRELEACVLDLPYRRYRLVRGCAPIFDSFLGVFSTVTQTPQVTGILKGSIFVSDIDESLEAEAAAEVGPMPDMMSAGVTQADVVEWHAKTKLVQKRILNSQKEAANASERLRAFYAPHDYIVRVYVYRGYYLIPPKGVGSRSNPHIVLKAPYADDECYPHRDGSGPPPWPPVHNTLSPSWRHTFADIGPVSVPGSKPLEIEVWDRQCNAILSDDWTLIGATKIDLDDRIFSPWAMGFSYYCVPVETRSLWAPTARSPQGLLECFVQVLTLDQARQYPPINLKGPGPEDFELHAIVWGCKGIKFPPGKVVAKEDMVGCLCCKKETVNPKVTMEAKWTYPAQSEDHPALHTDVHFASDDATAEFNWRAVLPVTLPCSRHFLQMNVWDESCIPGVDPVAIAESTFNLKSFFEKAHMNPTKPLTICRDFRKGAVAAGVGKALAKRSVSRRNKLRGEWISVSHPKAMADEVTAQVRLTMTLYPRRLLSADTPLCGEDGWAELGKPRRPPGAFNPLNPIGWVRYAIYKYKYKFFCAVLCLCCCLWFIIFLYLYLQLAPLMGLWAF